MTWTAPTCPRVDEPSNGTERATLDGLLDPDPGFPRAYGRCSWLSAWWRRAKIAAWTRSCRPSLVRMLRT